MKPAFNHVIVASTFIVWILPLITSCGESDEIDSEEEKTDKTSSIKYVDLGLSVIWATCNVKASNLWERGKIMLGEKLERNTIIMFLPTNMLMALLIKLPSIAMIPNETKRI